MKCKVQLYVAGKVFHEIVEAGQRDNADTDPYEETTPEVVLDYVKSTVRETVTA